MIQLIYDGSFEGLLTAVFEVYERKLSDVKIVRDTHYQPDLLGEPLTVIADASKAERVWAGLKQKLSVIKRNEVFKTFLSERADMETILLAFIRRVFLSAASIEKDFGDKNVLAVSQIAHQVHREKHRMEAFVRFQRTRENVYFSLIDPDFNVLPLIASHFKDRYADQHWLIYDRKRNYGIQYDKDRGDLKEVLIDLIPEARHAFLPLSVVHEDEPAYQTLWKDYFQSVNIGALKNSKLHLRHVPMRYWKFLTEKK